MRLGFVFGLAAVGMLALQPAFAQSSGGTMPAGTQNPAVAQPRLIAPPELISRPSPQPAPAGPQPDAPSPSSMTLPGGAGGLCECLINHDPGAPAFDKSKMHQACLVSVDACQAVCNSPRVFSFVPQAVYSCPGRPDESSRPVAANERNPVRLATSR
jgi:hypothetical protein